MLSLNKIFVTRRQVKERHKFLTSMGIPRRREGSKLGLREREILLKQYVQFLEDTRRIDTDHKESLDEYHDTDWRVF